MRQPLRAAISVAISDLPSTMPKRAIGIIRSTTNTARNEIGNWRAAVQWALNERNDVLAGQRLVAEVASSWGDAASVFGDARRWIPVALDLIDEQTPPDVVAKLKHADAFIAMHLHDHHKLQLASAHEAIAYYREVGDELRLVRAIDLAGRAFNDFGRDAEARAILEEGLQIARKLGFAGTSQ